MVEKGGDAAADWDGSLDERQIHIRDDLRDLTTGDILVEDLERAAYATDGSMLEVRPLAVVAPRSAEEVAAIVAYAASKGISVHPRGAGTGLAGESLGPGLMIDLCRHFGRILEVNEKSVRVEPGVRCSELAERLAPMGRMFPPDPVSAARCTLGGMIATDAAGPHSLRYGTTADYVLRMKVVLGDGSIVEFGRESIDPMSHPARSPLRRLAPEVASILAQHQEDIQHEQPSSLLKPGGYNLRGLLGPKTVDLARLLVGAEGTLGIVVEAELATLPMPRHRGLLLASFSSLEAASHAVVESLEYLPTACELLDRRQIALVRDAHPLFTRCLPPSAEAMLMLEQEGSSPENVRERVLLMSNRLGRVKRLASETVRIFRKPEIEECWEVRHRATPKLGHAAGYPQPLAFIENTAVPPRRLPEFLKAVQDVIKRYGATASYVAHAGVGILHTRPLLDPRRPEQRRTMAAIARATLDVVLEFGGTNNGEHGVGLLRSGLLALQYPKLMSAFAKIKAAFDPQNVLNPGRLANADAGFPLKLLRTLEAPSAEPIPKSHLVWGEISPLEMAGRCNGCGACMTTLPATRMCPSFKASPTELAAPRSKANLMRQVLTGAIDPRLLPTPEFRELAEYCVNCKMCRLECPSAVDMSKLMLEAKAASVVEQGLNWTDWFFSNLDFWSRWASGNALFANALLRQPAGRWLLERLFGLSRRRRLPRFHHATFLRRAARNGWTRKPRWTEPRPKVALFVDLFAEHNDPQLGECIVRVLEHHRRRVYVPPDQVASGMAPLTHGDVDAARAALEHNVAIFAELARDGYDIVTPEPAAALMFRQDARNLITDPDLALLASRTYEFTEYLAFLDAREGLRSEMAAIPATIGYHEPCHQRALERRTPVAELLERIPKLRVVEMNLGCSGMAGTWGLRAAAREGSLLAGKNMLERLGRSDLHFGVTQCSACRLQMEEGAGKRTIHPAKWFAVAYGLVKRPERIFRPVSGRLIDS